MRWTTYSGILWLISPASSMKRVGMPTSWAFQDEVERIDGNAMAAEAGAGVEGLEAEGLGAGGGDDLPDVDAHGGEDDFHFVDQGDVDGAVDVFQQLGGFGDLGGGDGDDFVDGLLVEGDGDFAGDFVDAADEFGDGLGGGVFSAGVFAFGGEGEEEVGAAAQAAGLEQGQDDFAGGAGIGGGFEDDELSGAEAAGDFVGGFCGRRKGRARGGRRAAWGRR